jgi:iron complex transport system substrate-binding protein
LDNRLLAAAVALACAVAVALLTLAPEPAPPEGDALISLSPPITAAVYAIGAGEQLVGRSDWCRWPPEAEALPSFGSSLDPNYEAIAAARPGLLLTERVGTKPDLHAAWTVETLRWLSLTEVVTSVRRLGVLTGREAEAAALADRFATLDVPRPSAGPEALLLFGGEPDGNELFYVRADSLHGAAMRAAGLRNRLPDPPDGPPAISLERLLQLDPELLIVLVASDGDGLRERITEAWSSVPALQAVSEGRVGVVAGPHTMATGPRIFDFVDDLRDEVARLR